jgi:hypothetical protein
MNVYGGVDALIHVLLTSVLVGDESLISRPCRLISGANVPFSLDRMLGGPQSRSGHCAEDKPIDSNGIRTPISRSSSP